MIEFMATVCVTLIISLWLHRETMEEIINRFFGIVIVKIILEWIFKMPSAPEYYTVLEWFIGCYLVLSVFIITICLYVGTLEIGWSNSKWLNVRLFWNLLISAIPAQIRITFMKAEEIFSTEGKIYVKHKEDEEE